MLPTAPDGSSSYSIAPSDRSSYGTTSRLMLENPFQTNVLLEVRAPGYTSESHSAISVSRCGDTTLPVPGVVRDCLGGVCH